MSLSWRVLRRYFSCSDEKLTNPTGIASLYGSRSSSSRRSLWFCRIECSDPRKILLVLRNDHAAIRQRNRSDDRVECAAGSPSRLSLRHQFGPDYCGALVEWENASGKKHLRPIRAFKPTLQIPAALSRRKYKNPAPDFCDRERRNKQVFVIPISQPGEELPRPYGLCEFADYVCIK